MAAAAAALAMGIGATRSPRACAASRASRHRLERVRERGRRPLRQRLQGDQRRLGAGRRSTLSTAALRLILGGSLKGESFEPLVRPVAERCVAVYLIGAAEDQLAIELAGAAAAGVARRALGHARAGGRGRGRPRRRRARSCCSRRRARASTPSRTSSSAASASASWWRPCREREGRRQAAHAAADRVLAAADGDALPARVRRRDGLQRQLRRARCSPRAAATASTTSKRTLLFGAIGLLAMRLAVGQRRRAPSRALTPLSWSVSRSSFSSRCSSPGSGRRSTARSAGSAPGCCQFQPSELLKIALVLYGAHLLADGAEAGPDACAGSAPTCWSWGSRCC